MSLLIVKNGCESLILMLKKLINILSFIVFFNSVHASEHLTSVDILNSFNYSNSTNEKKFRVCSNSMYPVIPTGSLIKVDRNTDLHEITTGDIIVYKTSMPDKHNSKHVVHRVVMTNGNQLFCKGDQNQSLDQEIIDKRNFVGVVTSIEKPYVISSK